MPERRGYTARPRPTIGKVTTCPGCNEPGNITEKIGAVTICIGCAARIRTRAEHTRATRRQRRAERPEIARAFRNDERRKQR